jgi:hypothetical protein
VNDHSGHPGSFAFDGDYGGVEENINAAGGQHIVNNTLQRLAIERSTIGIGIVVGDSVGKGGEALEHLPPRRVHRLRFAAERVDASGCALSAEEPVTLDQYDVSAGFGGADRRKDPGNSATGNDYVGFGRRRKRQTHLPALSASH